MNYEPRNAEMIYVKKDTNDRFIAICFTESYDRNLSPWHSHLPYDTISTDVLPPSCQP